MATGENVGAIYYTVEADTSKLLDSVTPADASLDGLNRTFSRTDKAANSAQFQMTKTAAAVKGLGRQSESALSSLRGLGAVLGGLISIQGARGLIEMAEAYNEMAERVQMATRSTEEYTEVQARLLNTANRTYRSLAEAQEVYVRTADSLRSMGYETDQALDITDSLSYAFVKNAASVDRASGATDAFSKVLNKGKVEADAWETIIAAIPTVINDIAAASGKTSAEIRQMGVSGEISARQLTEGLRRSLEDNRKAADGMATTLRDAFTALRNNLSAYVGEANRSTGATSVLSSAILALGNNIDTIVKLLMVAGAGALAKYVAGLAASGIQAARAALAARAQAEATLAQAVAHEAAAAAAAGQAAANVRLGGAQAAATAAAAAHRQAQTALAAAQAATTATTGGLLAALGGPAGIIALVASAAAGFVLFGDNARGAASQVDDLTDSIDKLGKAQLALRQQQASELIAKLEKDAYDAGVQTRALEKDYAALQARLGRGVTEEGLRNVNASLVEQRAEQERATEALEKAREAQRKLNEEIERRSKAPVPGASGGTASDPEVKKRLQALRDEAAAARLTGEERAKLLAVQKLGDKATQEEIAEAERLAVEIYNLERGQKGATKATSERTEAEKANAKVVDELAQSLVEAGLSGEQLAVAKARASLNKFATPEEVANVEALAKAIYEASQAPVNKQLLGQVDPIAGEQMGFQTQIENLRKLNEAKLLEDQRYLDLKAQAETAHDERMKVLQEENFRRQSTWNDLLMGSLDQLASTGADALIGIASGVESGTDAVRALAGAIMREAVTAFVQMGIAQVKAWIMGRTAQAAAGVAYAASVSGQVAANTALAAQGAYAATAAIPYVGPFLAPAAAATAAAAAGAIGAPAIGASGLVAAAGRQYGGPVGPSGMYRINENGAPEILNTASGRQYLLPNSRGEVVSNKDAASGAQAAAPAITINLIEDESRAGEVAQRSAGDEEYVIDMFVADISSGGRASRSIEAAYRLRRQGR